MKKNLTTGMLVVFPLLRAWFMNDFLIVLIFQILNLEYSYFFSNRPEHFPAKIAVLLIWAAYYLPFLVLFRTDERQNILPVFIMVISATAVMGFIELLGETIPAKTFTGWPIWYEVFFFWFFSFISIPVFIIEAFLLAFKIWDTKNIGFLKSLGISVLSFLVLPFLLVLGVQMILG